MRLQPCTAPPAVRDDRGFTLNELLVTVGILVVVSAMAVATFASAIPMVRANGQAQRLIGLMQLARETAIMRQRDVELVIDPATRRTRLMVFDGGGATILREVIFEYDVSFQRFPGMGDTPDRFGDGGDIDFGGAARLLFISDGSLVDEDDLPVNGTMFFGITGQPPTARAITLTGTTARARYYAWSGSGWAE